MKKRLLLIVLMLIVVLSVATACELLQPAPQHQHTFETTWSSDETNHYYKATCEHFNVMKDNAPHTFGTDGKCTVCGYDKNGAQTHKHVWENGYCSACQSYCLHKDATLVWEATEITHQQYYDCCKTVVERGSHTFGTDGKCSVCGYVQISTQPHEHVWENGACSECGESCKHEALSWSQTETAHEQNCSTCGKAVQQGSHAFGEAEYLNGKIVTTCTVCGYKHYENDTHTHEYQNGVCTICNNSCLHPTVSLVWEKTETTHEQTCKICGKITKRGEHNLVGPLVVDEPSLDKEGKVRYTCTDCQYQKFETTPKLTITSLSIVTQPTKTTYNTGETFDSAGMVVNATFSNGKTTAVQGWTADKTTLVAGDTVVTISYYGKTAQVSVTVLGYQKYSVAEVLEMAAETTVFVEGVYVGIADEGLNSDKEMLIKDLSSDKIIAVRNVTYGEFPSYGYEIGDKINIHATVKVDGGANTPNKKYLDFNATQNGEIATTVVSKNNAVSCALDNYVSVSSWADLQSLVSVGEITEYTYVRITGTIYFNVYNGNDGIQVFRFHTNSGATKVAEIKPDGARSMSLRANVMETNLGSDWYKMFFETIPATGQYPGTPVEGTLTVLYTGANGSYFQFAILGTEWFAPKEEQKTYTNEEILKEVAYAYHRQGNQSQYDQTQSRRDLINSPEDATEQDGLVLDCSSYANSVYKEAFGVNILPNTNSPNTSNFASYAKNNPNNVDVIGYWETADYTTEAQRKELLDSIRSQLKVGDCINYRHGASSGTSGHVMVYVGDNYFLHSTGSSYVYNTDPTTSYDKATSAERSEGTVQLLSADAVFTLTSSYPKRYLFYSSSSDTTYNFCVLRPLNRGLTPTAKSLARMTIQGLDMEKTVSAGEYGAIYNGSEVTYTLTLKNTSNVALTNVTFSETLGEYSTFVSSTRVSANGKKLTWTGNVPAKSTVTLSYVVKVETTKQSAQVISESTVNGVRTNVLHNTISLYTQTQMQSIATTAKGYASSSKGFTNPILMVKQLYKDVLGVDLFDYTTVSTALVDLIDSSAYTCKTDTAVSKMLAPGLYGGLDIKSGYTKDSFRARLLEEANLAVGDIIICEYSGKSTVYVYVGNNTLVGINSTDDVCFSVEIGTEQYTKSGSSYVLKGVLTTMVAFDRYAVLRPSMIG